MQLLASVGVVAEEFGFATDERLYLIIAIAAYSVFITGALGLAGRLYRQYAVGVALAVGLRLDGLGSAGRRAAQLHPGWVGHPGLLHPVRRLLRLGAPPPQGAPLASRDWE